MIISCSKEKTEISNAQLQLIGTSWTVEKIDVYSLNQELIKSISIPENTLCPRFLNFTDKDFVAYYESCNEIIGCGQWTVRDNEIHFGIAVLPKVYGYCGSHNFSYSLIAHDLYELSESSLVIEGLGATLNAGIIDAEWSKLRDDYLVGKVTIETYFHKVELTLPYEPTCCKTLSWM